MQTDTINIKEVKEDLAKLDGVPPHNTPSNPCWHDGYYALSLEKKYGMKIEDLRHLVKKNVNQ